jgi:protein-S-isoprenylcysteine O-methyltransferase Ste14
MILRLMALGFWAVSFLLSLLALVYLVGFVLNRYTFSSIDSGLQIPTREAIVVNLVLLGLFGLQHSGMARRWFKRFMPWPIERSVYLLATAAILLILYVKWEPMPKSVWLLTAAWPFQLLQALAGALVIWATVAQGALNFFGFHQVWAYVRGRTYSPPPFKATGPYRYTRHPMMIGTLTFFWATPDMTEGHLLFAAVMTVYVLMAVRWEERDYRRLPIQ